MIGKDKVFIIAEAGVNHNGDLNLALKLIESAKKTGADAIKFQTWKTENVIAKNSPKAPYQDEIMGSEESQYEMLKQLELPYKDFTFLKEYCDKIGIEFMSTADEWESAVFLNQLVRTYKVGSAELTDTSFLSKIASFNKETILSTGMANMEEVKAAISVLNDNGLSKNKINILHAHTEYPSEYRDLNLNAITTLKKELGLNIGYSDHSRGIEVPIAAVAMGAKIIEKHFTLDRTMKGPDHSSSLEPEQFKEMVCCIRNIEQAFGDGIKKASAVEMNNIPFIRKSIVAKGPIMRGEVLSEKNITVKRPGTGIAAQDWNAVVGRLAVRDFAEDELISFY